MKILSLTPLNKTNFETNKQKSQNFFITNQYNRDTVSFQGGKNKAIESAAENMFNGFLENISGDLGKKVKELMSNDKSRPIFMTMLVSLAATATDLIMKSNNSKTKAENKAETVSEETELPVQEQTPEPTEEKNKDNGSESPKTEEKEDKARNTQQATKKTGRKSIVDKMGEETFIDKLQQMGNHDYTLEQMSKELNGLSITSVSKYLKKYNIQKSAVNIEKPEKPAEGEKDLDKFIDSNPARREYLKTLEEYPNLYKQYKNCLENTFNNPQDKTTTDSLEGMEKTFDFLMGLKSKHRKQYFEKYNEIYGDSFDKIAIILNNIKPDKTLQEYLATFMTDAISTKLLDSSGELLNKWVEYPSFTIEELQDTEGLAHRSALYEAKKQGLYTFKLIKNENYHKPAFILHFNNDLKLSEKLKAISEFHEALYDNIYLHKDNKKKVQRIVDIQEELQKHLIKDKNLDSIYNLLKYITPETMETVEYEPEKYVPAKDLELSNSKTKKQMEEIIRELNIKSNPRLQELEDVINDNEMFGDLIENNHAKLRFISRFVLNKKVKDNELHTKCNNAVKHLEKDIEYKLKHGCLIFPYIMTDSSAPSFYLDKSILGDFIKITLNNQGQIHTIFEDQKRKSGIR